MGSSSSLWRRRSALIAAVFALILQVRPCPAAQRVVLISVDGLRPDAIQAAGAATLLALIAGGSYHEAALNELPPATLPNHVTMLTGLPVAVHGVLQNTDLPGHVGEVTIFDVAAAAGLRCGFFASKSKLDFLAPLNPTAVVHIDSDQAALMDRVLEEFTADPFDLTFIHLREPDSTGHRSGWMSEEYLAAVRSSDAQIGRLMGLLTDLGFLETTDVLVTSDHGGEGFVHVLNTPAVREIPWIASGPSFAAGRNLCEPVVQPDTPATVLTLLGLAFPSDLPGHAVEEAFRDIEQPACQTERSVQGPPCMVFPLALAAGLGVVSAFGSSARRGRSNARWRRLPGRFRAWALRQRQSSGMPGPRRWRGADGPSSGARVARVPRSMRSSPRHLKVAAREAPAPGGGGSDGSGSESGGSDTVEPHVFSDFRHALRSC